MQETRKVLVAFDPENPSQESSDFLVPVQLRDGEAALLGSQSGNLWKYGLVVLTSRAVNRNDLFAKLIDVGQKEPSVDDCLARLDAFVEQLKSVRIGSIVEVLFDDGELKLTVAASTPDKGAKDHN